MHQGTWGRQRSGIYCGMKCAALQLFQGLPLPAFFFTPLPPQLLSETTFIKGEAIFVIPAQHQSTGTVGLRKERALPHLMREFHLSFVQGLLFTCLPASFTALEKPHTNILATLTLRSFAFFWD